MTIHGLIGIILFVIALSELAIGLRFLFRYQRSASTIFYGLFALGTALYVGANGLGYGGHIPLWIGERLSWCGGALATILFLPFVYSYPTPQRSMRELLPLVVWPILLFIPAMLFTDLIVRAPESTVFGNGYRTATGDYFWAFLVFYAVYWLWSLIVLGRRMVASDGIHRHNLQLVFTGIILSLSAATIFDVVIPITSASQLGFIGSLMTSAWLGVTAYILVRR